MVSLTINGQKVEVEPETTILQAAEKLGFFIPTFCYDPELSLPGTCGICVVQVENSNELATSCCTPVEDGMVVYTDTEQVHAAREEVLTKLRAIHPMECFTCEKSGECLLQDYCFLYGIFQVNYQGEQEQGEYGIDDSNPFFIRDMNKCIQCTLCVRKCHEVNGAGAFDVVSTDSSTDKITVEDVPSDSAAISFDESSCVFCGMCVDACPVGALIPKQVSGGRTWEPQRVKTICPYCGVGCGLELRIKDNTVVNVKGDRTNPVNRGHTCAKGRFGYDFLHSPARLKSPLIRKKGELVEASWEEALDTVAEKLKGKEGMELAGLTSARATNEENYLFQKLFRSLKSNNVDHCARL